MSTGISEIIEELTRRKARRVALQVPDGLKRQAVSYARELKKAGFSVIISGDPCYGACDLADDAAARADVLVHIGHAPLGDHPGVIYQPYRMEFPLEALDAAIPLLQGRTVGVVTTVQHAHLVPEIIRYLGTKGISASACPGGPRAPLEGQVLGCSFGSARSVDAYEVLYVGTGRFHPAGVALATGKRVVALDPYTGEASVVDVSRMVRRRFAVMEKARSAGSFGVLVSSKGGQERMDLAERLARLHDDAHIVIIREVTPEALINLGFDAYVNTACPRIAYDDQERFSRPVLSPAEFEAIMGAREMDAISIDEILE